MAAARIVKLLVINPQARQAMLIVYCEKCGLRVPDAPQDAPPGSVFCATCAAAAVPVPVADRPKSSGRHKQQTPTGGLANLAPEPAKHAAPARGKKSAFAKPLMAAAGMLVVVVAFFALRSGTPPEKTTPQKSPRTDVAAAPKTDTKTVDAPNSKPATAVIPPPQTDVKPEPTPEPSKPPETAKPSEQPKPPQPLETVNARDEFAARRWAELQTKPENATEYAHRQAIESFAQTYAGTTHGREAAEWLAKTPAPPPPVKPPDPTPATPTPGKPNRPAKPAADATLVNLTFDDAKDLAQVKVGSGDGVKGADGSGRGIKGSPTEKRGAVNGAAVEISLDKHVSATMDSWVRFAVNAKNIGSVKIVVEIENKKNYSASKEVAQADEGKWTWITVNLTDLRGGAGRSWKTQSGTSVTGVALQGSLRENSGTPVMLIDNLTLGTGTPPEIPGK